MLIIELCGMPGCGKSTTLCNLKKQYPELAGSLKGWSDLYPPFKWMRALIKLAAAFRIKTGLLFEDEKKLYDIMRAERTSGGRRKLFYSAKVLALYGRIKKHAARDGVYLLDEGLVQQISSLGYGEASDKDSGGAGKPGGESLGKGFIPGCRYIGVYFECSTEECLRRNRERNRKNRYNVSDDGRLMALLDAKKASIERLLSPVCDYVYRIDTRQSESLCVKQLGDILLGIIKQQEL